MKYVPLACKTHYTLCKALNQPKHLADHQQNLEIPRLGIADINNISCSLAVKDKLNNPIIGCTISVYGKGDFILLAKNKNGWLGLIKLSLAAQEKDGEERIFKTLGEWKDDLVFISYTYPYQFLPHQDWKTETKIWFDSVPVTDKYISVTLSGWHPPGFQNKLRELGLPVVALPDSYYCTEEQHEDLQILLCLDQKLKLKDAKEQGGQFFDYSGYHIPSYKEMIELGYSERELSLSLEISDKCEEYDISNEPLLPKMSENSPEKLRQECRDGWRRKIINYVPEEKHPIYADRIKYELSVIDDAELSDYFLMVMEIERYAKSQGWFVGPGRGSAAGCLISYLIDITEVNPIKHDLLFGRFYSAARKGSLPDIDCDFPIESVPDVISFIRRRFGEDKTCHISTYQTLKGRAALTAVFSAHGFEFQDVKRITDKIVPDHKVNDKMQEEKETSLIRFCLRHYPKDFEGYCYLNEDGTLGGQYAPFFSQAIRLEHTKRTLSQHACGFIISSRPIVDVAPILVNKHGERALGLEMDEAERVGLIKMDVLSLATLDKTQKAAKYIAETGVMLL
jgi:DNA polymerase-3 subunit alpha